MKHSKYHSKSEQRRIETMKERQSKSWICNHCVKTKYPTWMSAYPTGGNTMLMGLCGHCEWPDEDVLTPTCDYRKPGQPSPVWD